MFPTGASNGEQLYSQSPAGTSWLPAPLPTSVLSGLKAGRLFPTLPGLSWLGVPNNLGERPREGGLHPVLSLDRSRGCGSSRSSHGGEEAEGEGRRRSPDFHCQGQARTPYECPDPTVDSISQQRRGRAPYGPLASEYGPLSCLPLWLFQQDSDPPPAGNSV